MPERTSAAYVRAENADAARLYESMGFVPIGNPAATHIIFFQ